jgi:hypothetical protein
MLFMTYSLYAIIYRYIYQYIHKKFIISPTYHDIPCTNSYILYQSRYSICLYKNVYIYIPLVYHLFITSVPLFIPLAFYVFMYIYIARWLIVGLPFIYQYICIYHYTLYPQYTIIYTSVYHIGLPLAYTLYLQYTIMCVYIYIHISISPRYIQSLSFFSGYQDAALIFQPSQLVLRGADDGCPGWCGMKSSGKC